MKSMFLFIVSCTVLLMAACNNGGKTRAYRRIVFNAAGLQVLSSSVNKKLETMSLLYGNSEACQTLIESDIPDSGGVFKFVTWQYHDNPFFYGSKINGELLSVESIGIQGNGLIDYEIEKGDPLPVNGIKLSRQERIKYILGHKQSQLP